MATQVNLPCLHRYPYHPPPWINGTDMPQGEQCRLAIIPKCRVKLSMKNTPIHEWRVPGVPAGFQLFVKREDLTGSTLSGNKVRKLEFLLGDALDKGCDSLVTFGGVQSNHARATALAGKQIGLQTHIILKDQEDEIGCKGNLLLSRLAGANIIVSPPERVRSGSTVLMHKYADKLRSEGHRPYVIPAGGLTALGSWGYIDTWQEMMKQGVLEEFDDIFLAAASTGTACGLAIANYLTGSKLKIHAVSVGFPKEVCYTLLDKDIQELGLKDVKAHNIVEVLEDYIGLGYGKSTKQELALIADVICSTGLSLDPTYTVKAVLGMITEMKEHPDSFQGRRVLFIHTGGIFGLYDGTINEEVASNPHCNRIRHLNAVMPDS